MFCISGLADRILVKLEKGTRLDQLTLVQAALWFAIANATMYCLVPAPDSVLHRNLGAIGGFFLLLVTVRWGGFLTICIHGLLLLQFGQLVAMASHFGGINSPYIASMPLLPITALLLLNMRWALAWLAIIALQNYGQYVAVTHAWINGAVDPQTLVFPAVLFSKASTLLFLTASLHLYDWTYRKKIYKFSADSHALNKIELDLQQAQNKIKAFVDHIADNVRTPLEMQVKLSPILIAELNGQVGNSEAAHQIRLDTQKLLQTSKDLIDIANIERVPHTFTLSSFFLPDLIAFAIAASAPERPALQSSLTLHTDASAQIWVQGDAARLRQSATRLLTYARQQADAGNIAMSMRFTDTRVVIEISLVSRTIKDLPSSNPPFASAVPYGLSSTHDLGLAVCASLAAEAGGQFCVYRRSTHKILLWLEWPLGRQAMPAPPTPSSSSLLTNNKRFLVIENLLSSQLEVHALLKRLWPQCHVGLAENAGSALLQMEFSRYDMVFINLSLPPADTIATARQMRTHALPSIRTSKIVGLATKGQFNERQRYLENGIEWLLFKPLDPAVFFAVVTAHLTQGPDQCA